VSGGAVRPPRLARWLIQRGLPPEAAEAIAGDLDERFSDDLRRGASPSRARLRYWRQALASVAVARGRREFSTREVSMPRASVLTGVTSDVRFVLRGFARTPGYVAVAVLSLAIGIGANVATLSVTRAILLQDLPVERPRELRWVSWSHPKGVRVGNYNSSNDSNYSYPAYEAVRNVAGSRIQLLGFNFAPRLSLIASGRAPVAANGMMVSGDYFTTLGLGVILGRPLGDDDNRPGAPRVAVIGNDLWQRLFDSRPDVVGHSIRINDVDFEIVGVTPRRYVGLSIGGFFRPTDITVPLSAQPIVAPYVAGRADIMSDPTRLWIHIIARLPDAAQGEAFRQSAQIALAPMDAALAGSTAVTGATAVTLSPANRGVDQVARRAGEPLEVLTGASVLVLLIACANLAGLMLARGIARSRETAVRRALGASRATLIRQWVIEGLILALAGGACGVVVAIWSGPAIVHLLTTGLGPVAIELSADWGLIALGLGLTIATAVLGAALPAWRLTRAGATTDLRTQVIGASSPRLTIGRVLIAVQIAISVPLLVGALLFVQTLRNLSAVDLGFDPRGLVEFQINLPGPVAIPGRGAQPMTAETAGLTRNLLTALEAIPGVSSATLVENPLVSGISSNWGATIDGKSVPMAMQAVGPHFFETMRIPLLAGRAITDRDIATAPLVAVVNRATVGRAFHGASPIGKTMLVGTRELTIVGVVDNSIYESLRRQPQPTFYDSYLQRPGMTLSPYVTLRTVVSPATLVAPVTAAVAALAPTAPLTNFKTQTDQIAETTGEERVFSRLLTLFAGFAMALAGIGLYGLTSYAVARRTNEIGIRIALGAARTQVQRLMLRQVVVLAALGLAAGVPLALLSSRFIATLVFGVTPRDPSTLVEVAITMLVAAIAAGWLPARRASRLEPLSALRTE